MNLNPQNLRQQIFQKSGGVNTTFPIQVKPSQWASRRAAAAATTASGATRTSWVLLRCSVDQPAGALSSRRAPHGPARASPASALSRRSSSRSARCTRGPWGASRRTNRPSSPCAFATATTATTRAGSGTRSSSMARSTTSGMFADAPAGHLDRGCVHHPRGP